MSKVKNENDDIDPYVLRVRGLPWSASKDDIIKFFSGCNIKNGPNGIHLTMSREGRPSGEAYVEFETPEDTEKGLEKNNEHLGTRYIEVFRSKQNEMEWALRKCGLDGEDAFGDACVRLRGLPFGCSKEEIAQFFTGLEIVRNGITLPTDFQGRSTGEAYVQFASQEIAEKAMGKHKEKIGHRYIEIFKSSLQEIRSSMGMGPMRMKSMGSSNRVSPYDRMDRPSSYGGRGGRGGRGRGGGPGGPSINNFPDRGGMSERIRDTGHNIHMRGLPFRAVERDLFEFFAPLKPIAVRIKYEASGRSSGEADAMFATHEEAVRAMKKDKEKIQHRYIELFLQSEPEVFNRRGEGGMGAPYGGGPGQFGRGGNRPFMPETESGFGPSNMGPDRGFGGGMGSDRGFGQGGGPTRGFGGGNDRSFGIGTGGGGYGSSSVGPLPNRGFGMGSMSGNDRDYGFSSDKPFAQNPLPERSFAGGTGARSFGSAQQERSFGPSDRYGDDRGYGMSDNFRNGMNSGSMQSGNLRNEAPFGTERTNESEFYGSGKLFGESSYPSSVGQGMNMMNPTTYPGF